MGITGQVWQREVKLTVVIMANEQNLQTGRIQEIFKEAQLNFPTWKIKYIGLQIGWVLVSQHVAMKMEF